MGITAPLTGRWHDWHMSRAGLLVRMLTTCAAVLLALAAASPAPAAVPADPGALSGRGHILTISLQGVVDPFTASYVQRGIKAASDGGYEAVALTIDTPGGLDSSMREIVRAIVAAPLPVICYVPPGGRAASAGTFIMLACPVNGMAPGSSIGAAHPVGVSGAIEQAKVTNDAASYIRSLAAREDRDADWAERAVRDSISAGAESALGQHIVDFVAPDLSAMIAHTGSCASPATVPATGAARTPGYAASACGATQVAFHQSPGESFFHAFADPTVAFILLDIALVALIVWAFHPHFHAPLAVGVVSLAVGLAILQTLPVRLVGFGLLFIAAVLFVLDVKARAHGVLTAGGIVVFILGGLLLFNPAVPSARVALPVLLVIPVGLGTGSAFMIRAMRAARHQPLRAGAETLPGATGVAETDLDPDGRVRLRGQSWAASSVGGRAAAGTPVRVVAVTGLTLQVQPEPATILPSQS